MTVSGCLNTCQRFGISNIDGSEPLNASNNSRVLQFAFIAYIAYIMQIYMQISNKKNQPTNDEIRSLEWLADAIRSRQISQELVANSIGVHQSQVSRILSGAAKRSSPNLRKICKYANSMRGVTDESSADVEQMLNNAIQHVWDGSVDHANALKVLIEAVGDAQSAHKRNSQ